jgi:hypothetical protein
MKLIRHPNVIRMHEVMHIQYISRIYSLILYYPVNEIQYISTNQVNILYFLSCYTDLCNLKP